MGGKSRKTGGVSKKLIDRIKQGAPSGSGKGSSDSASKKSGGQDAFGLEDSMKK